MKIIKLSVSNFRNMILNKEDITFDKVGVISHNKNILEFKSSKTENYLKHAYGLSNVSISIIKRSKKEVFQTLQNMQLH